MIGADPLDKEGIKHLHFELWRGVNDAVDPAPFLTGREVFTPKEVSALMPNLQRNARGEAREREEPDLVHVTDYWRAKPGRAARPDVAPSLISTTHDGAAR